MNDYRIKVDSLSIKINQMLESFDQCDDVFVKYFFECLTRLYDDVIYTYENKIAELNRKIFELDKEIIFANMPGEDYKEIYK